jgi:replicative DNA helicase
MSEQKDFSKFGKTYQDKVLQAVLTDHIFADQMSDVIDPKYFTFAHHEAVADVFFGYRLKYKEFPSSELVQTMLEANPRYSGDGAIKKQVSQYLDWVATNPLNGDKAWIEESSLDFCRKQAVLQAMVESLTDVENSNFLTIRKKIGDALEKGERKDHGHEYGVETLDDRAENVEKVRIPTGWSPLNEDFRGGLVRPSLCTIIAPTGVGKTAFLCNFASDFSCNGWNALYVSCEMPEKDIGVRCDSIISEIPFDDVPAKRQQVAKAISQKMTGRLIIKSFPTKRATVETLRNHIQRLKRTKDFKPDVMIVDYADLLRPSSRYGEKRHELEGVYEELRGLAQEEDMIIFTADQTNRGGLEQEIVTLSSIAEAFAKATVCDLILTAARTADDKQAGTGKIFVAKSRFGPDGGVFPFLMDTSKSFKIKVLNKDQDPLAVLMQDDKFRNDYASKRFSQLMGKDKDKEKSK